MIMSEPRTEHQDDPWTQVRRFDMFVTQGYDQDPRECADGEYMLSEQVDAAMKAERARHAEEIAALKENNAFYLREYSGQRERAEKAEAHEATLREQLAAVQQALRMLRNESHAIRAMSYDAIKDSAGYTNLKVWTQRIEEADATIAALSSPSTQEPQTHTGWGPDKLRDCHCVNCQGETTQEPQTEWLPCPYCGKPLALVPAEGEKP